MKLTDTSFIVEGLRSEHDQAFDSRGEYDSRGSAAVAAVTLDSGTVLRFVDEGGSVGGTQDYGRIGVMEITAPKTDPLLPGMLREYGPSPLEIFLAAAGPNAEPPEKLVEDHRRAAMSRRMLSPAPRALALVSSQDRTKGSMPAHVVADVAPRHGLEVDYCTGLSGDFHFDFRSMETDVFGLQLSEHGHGHDLDHTHYGVTGLSSRRALGVCNAAGYVKTVRIQYEWIQGVWVEVPIAAPGSNILFPNVSVIYYSDSWPAVFRYRIKVEFTSVVDGNIVHTEGSW